MHTHICCLSLVLCVPSLSRSPSAHHQESTRRASKRVSRLPPSWTQYNQKWTHNLISTHVYVVSELLPHPLLYIHTGRGVRRARCCSGGQAGAGRSSNALLRRWRMRSWTTSRRWVHRPRRPEPAASGSPGSPSWPPVADRSDPAVKTTHTHRPTGCWSCDISYVTSLFYSVFAVIKNIVATKCRKPKWSKRLNIIII